VSVPRGVLFAIVGAATVFQASLAAAQSDGLRESVAAYQALEDSLDTLDERLARAGEALDRARDELHADHPYLATILLDLGRYAEESGDASAARRLLESAIRTLKVTKGPDDWTVGDAYMALGEFHQRAGQFTLGKDAFDLASASYAGVNARAKIEEGAYDEAVDLLLEIIRTREAVLGSVDADVALTVSIVGYVFRVQDRLEEAERYYRRALLAQEALDPEPTPDLAWTLNELGVTLSWRGRPDEAVPLFEKAIALWRKDFETNARNIAQGLFNVGTLHEEAGRLPQAAAAFERTLEIHGEVSGEESADVAEITLLLGRVYLADGRNADADAMFTRSERVRAALYGEVSREVAAALAERARVKHALLELRDWERLLVRAYEMRKAVLPPDHHELADSMDILGGLYHDTFRYEDSARMYAGSLAIWETRYSPDSPVLVDHFRILEDLYRRLGREAERIEMIERLLPFEEARLGPEAHQLEPLLTAAGGYYYENGRRLEAERLLERALPMQEATLGADSETVEETNRRLARIASEAGRLDEALTRYEQVLSARATRLGPDHPRVGMALNNVAMALLRLGRIAEAEPIFKDAVAIIDGADVDLRVKLTTLNNIAGAYAEQGRYDEARAVLRDALARVETELGPDDPELALGLNNLSSLMNGTEGEPLLQRAIDILEAAYGPWHIELFHPLDNMARLLLENGKIAAARETADRARQILERDRGTTHPDLAEIYTTLSRIAGREGDSAEALALSERALGVVEGAYGSEHPDVAVMLNNLAAQYNDAGKFELAENAYRRALEIHRRVLGDDHPSTGIVLDNLAVFYWKQERVAAALDVMRESIDISTTARMRREERATFGDAVHSDGYRYRFHLNLLALASRRGLLSDRVMLEEGFRVAQSIRADAAARAMRRAALRFAAGEGELAELIRRRQDLSNTLRSANAALVEALGAGDPARTDGIRAAIARTEGDLQAVIDTLASSFPDFEAFEHLPTVTVGEAEAALRDDEAMLVYAFGLDTGQLWVVTSRDSVYLPITLEPGMLKEDAVRLRESLIPMRPTSLRPFPAREAHRLYQRLIEPALPFLEDVRHLYVVADAELQGLPLGLLLTAPPERPRLSDPDALASAPWLARTFATTVLPGAGSLRVLRDRRWEGVPQHTPFLGFGDPLLQGEDGAHRSVGTDLVFRGRNALADVEAIRRLSRLPETAEELRDLASALGSRDGSLLLGADARESTVKTMDLSRTEVIAFATHGLVAGDFAAVGEPGLILTPPRRASVEDDGLLTAGEVAQLDLNAEWVVLSACNTAASDGTPGGEGLSGLAKAFFYAGARTLLVSHWPVETNAAKALTTNLFRIASDAPSTGRAEALRRAQITLIEDPENPHFAHPFFWAPFVVVGEGG
jgi:CHAT domain-containing protein/tetratricopeptide (TPR) repeat protein